MQGIHGAHLWVYLWCFQKQLDHESWNVISRLNPWGIHDRMTLFRGFLSTSCLASGKNFPSTTQSCTMMACSRSHGLNALVLRSMETNSLPLRLSLSDSPSWKQETLSNNTLLEDKISEGDKKNCPTQQEQVQGEESENNEKGRYSGSHLRSHSPQAEAEGQSLVRHQPGSQRETTSPNKSQRETRRWEEKHKRKHTCSYVIQSRHLHPRPASDGARWTTASLETLKGLSEGLKDAGLSFE